MSNKNKDSSKSKKDEKRTKRKVQEENMLK